jgi:hypothetical protein
MLMLRQIAMPRATMLLVAHPLWVRQHHISNIRKTHTDTAYVPKTSKGL